MQEIYSNDFLKISEDKMKSIFTIELSVANKVLINSLIRTKIIQGASVTDDYKEVKFKAQSVKSLKQLKEEQSKQTGKKSLSINLVYSMVETLVMQLDYLISIESSTIIGYTPENIIVINDKKFAFLGSELITEIDDEMIQISCPFTANDFYVSPEMLNINKLPSYVHYKTSYFSLACLIIYSLSSNDKFYKEYLNDKQPDRIIEILNNHPIKNTKLYWLLSRCLVEDQIKRTILFI
jgi:hypothetical protein